MAYIVYPLTLLSSCYYSAKANSTGRKKYVWLIVVIMTLVAGLRGANVGYDTSRYVHIFELIKSNSVELSWIGLEQTFVMFCRALLWISDQYTIVFVAMAFVTFSAILFRLWDFHEMGNYLWMVFPFFCMHFFPILNISRQYMAVAIVFWGTRYIKDQKFARYLIFVLLGTLIHRSAIIGLLFYAFEISRWRDLRNNQRIFIILGIFLVPFYGGYILINISKYFSYFDLNILNLGFMLPLKVVLMFLSWYGLKNSIYMQGVRDEIANTFTKVASYYITGILLTSIGYFFSYLDRIGVIFYLFEAVYVAMVLKYRSDSRLYKLIYLGIFVYIFGMEFISSGQGVIPYEFFWQG